jgi:hypothetical protein
MPWTGIADATPVRARPFARWTVLLLLLGVVGWGVSPQPARAEEAVPLDAKAKVLRRSELRSAVNKWAVHRLRFPSRCARCQGAGAVAVQRGRMVICPQCKGRKAWISPPDYRAVYFEMKSEAFRQLPGIQDAVEKQYKEGNQGKPWPRRIKRWRMRSLELIDDTHGIAWLLFDDAKSPTESRWVWSAGAKGKGEWCSYDARSDGAWPVATTNPEPQGDQVTGTEFQALRDAVNASARTFRSVDFLAQGNSLWAVFEPRSSLETLDHEGRIAGDALAVVAPMFLAAGSRNRIETEWRTWWRNPEGIARLLPTWTVSADRATLLTQNWASLTPTDQMSLLAWKAWEHAGWQRVVGTAAPAKPAAGPAKPPPAVVPPAAPDDPEPAPSEPPPASEPEPPPTAPAPPPPPAPPAPPPPEPTPARKGAAPEVTAKHKKDAEAGIAKMKEIFELAKTVYDEAQVARQAGSHDLFQEKLDEVRERMGEIQEAWYELVVAVMPGRDEGEREELADEHFGNMWNEINELKAIVRKLSAGSK